MLVEHIVSAGVVAQCLLALSVLLLALMIERLWVHIKYPLFQQRQFDHCLKLATASAFDTAWEFVAKQRTGWQMAAGLLLKNLNAESEQRQQLCAHWLQKERHYLNTRLKVIGLIATIAPLLGLLGTVFGIVEMFKAIAHNTGPVTPALLAEGMWTAMITTALGLMVAIPALLASHGLELLSQWRLSRIQDALNQLEFALQGLQSRTEIVGKTEKVLRPALGVVG